MSSIWAQVTDQVRNPDLEKTPTSIKVTAGYAVAVIILTICIAITLVCAWGLEYLYRFLF
jgi:hypothetical protein